MCENVAETTECMRAKVVIGKEGMSMLLFHRPWLPSGGRWQQEAKSGCKRPNKFGKNEFQRWRPSLNSMSITDKAFVKGA